MKPKVKMCGITSYEDAVLCAGQGADYLGFIINYPDSPRSVDTKSVQSIVTRIKEGYLDVKCVGVFVDVPAAEVIAIAEECGLDIAQLHGHESVAECEKIRQHLEVWKTVIAASSLEVSSASVYRPVVDKILFDSGKGSGVPINTAFFEDNGEANSNGAIDIIAGGLGADNIETVIRELHPEIIDINSRVESAPGKKDPTLVAQLFNLLATL